MSWTIKLETDPETGELLIPFPDDLMEQMAWQINDVLVWQDNKDGSWTIKKKEVQ